MKRRKGEASPPVGQTEVGTLETVEIHAAGSHPVSSWAYDTSPDYDGRMVMLTNLSNGQTTSVSQAFSAGAWNGGLDGESVLQAGTNRVTLFTTNARGDRVTTLLTQDLVL